MQYVPMQSLPLKLDSGGQTTVYYYVYSNDVFIFNYFFIRSRDIEATGQIEAIKYSFFSFLTISSFLNSVCQNSVAAVVIISNIAEP